MCINCWLHPRYNYFQEGAVNIQQFDAMPVPFGEHNGHQGKLGIRYISFKIFESSSRGMSSAGGRTLPAIQHALHRSEAHSLQQGQPASQIFLPPTLRRTAEWDPEAQHNHLRGDSQAPSIRQWNIAGICNKRAARLVPTGRPLQEVYISGGSRQSCMALCVMSDWQTSVRQAAGSWAANNQGEPYLRQADSGCLASTRGSGLARIQSRIT